METKELIERYIEIKQECINKGISNIKEIQGLLELNERLKQ